MIFINAGFFAVNSGLGIEAQTGFGQNVTSVDTENFINFTDNSNTLIANATNPSQTGSNSTGQNPTFDWFTDYIEVTLVSLQFAWNLVTGQFLGAFINAVYAGAPQWVTTFFYAPIGFVAFIWVLYQVTGKG